MIIVIDGNYFIRRAFHQVDANERTKGNSIIRQFLYGLLLIGKKFASNDFVFVWDTSLKNNVRFLEYPAYKEKRKKKPSITKEEGNYLFQQLLFLRDDVLPNLGFNNIFYQEGFEGDDWIARICCSFLDEKMIVTSDHDMLQCLSAETRIYNPQKNKIISYYSFIDDFGIRPQQYGEVLCIAGCDTDEVKGIEGVGKDTAISYLKGTLPGHYTKYKKIVSKVGREIVERNKTLVLLPHPDTPAVEHKQNKFSKKQFLRICEQYDIYDFLEGDTFEDWRTFFKGSWATAQGLKRNY